MASTTSRFTNGVEALWDGGNGGDVKERTSNALITVGLYCLGDSDPLAASSKQCSERFGKNISEDMMYNTGSTFSSRKMMLLNVN